MCKCCKKIGKLKVVVGPMKASKTSYLLNLLDRINRQKRKAIVFKPDYDNRYSNDCIVNHNKKSHKAFSVKEVEEIKTIILKEKPDVVLIDEIQFFNNDLVKGDIIKLINTLNYNSIDVIVSGLNLNYLNEPFEIVGKLLCLADNIEQLYAVCETCGNDNASHTNKHNDNGNKFELGTDEYFVQDKACYYISHSELFETLDFDK